MSARAKGRKRRRWSNVKYAGIVKWPCYWCKAKLKLGVGNDSKFNFDKHYACEACQNILGNFNGRQR